MTGPKVKYYVHKIASNNTKICLEVTIWSHEIFIGFLLQLLFFRNFVPTPPCPRTKQGTKMALKSFEDSSLQLWCKQVVGKKSWRLFLLRIHMHLALYQMHLFYLRPKMKQSLSPRPTAYWKQQCPQPSSDPFSLVFRWDKPAFKNITHEYKKKKWIKYSRNKGSVLYVIFI